MDLLDFKLHLLWCHAINRIIRCDYPCHESKRKDSHSKSSCQHLLAQISLQSNSWYSFLCESKNFFALSLWGRHETQKNQENRNRLSPDISD
jgi:hypothetical protein